MKKPALTKEQVERVINYVTERGIQRGKVQGKRFSDVDFAMGAASVFFALEMQDQVPASWILNPMSGEPIFTERSADDKKTGLH